LRLSLYRHEHGVETADGPRVLFDLARGEAHFGAARLDGPALRWELEPDGPDPSDALLSRPVTLDRAASWIVRCDRIDFPPNGVAYRHTHPGPGIRCLLHGRLEIETEGRSTVYGPGGAWFESGPDPVLATAGEEGETAFVRVLLLPAEWEGKRTIRYVDPADEEKPKRQRPTVFFDRAVALP
jgi:quercetin dioxygenase-like cupin family protein